LASDEKLALRLGTNDDQSPFSTTKLATGSVQVRRDHSIEHRGLMK